MRVQVVIYMHSDHISISSNTTNINKTIAGVEVIKEDPIVQNLPLDLDEIQSIDLQYNIGQLLDIYRISRVVGGNIEINYPVKDISEFEYLRYIESQFADANEISDLDPVDIDDAILNLIPHYLGEEGVDLPDDLIRRRRVTALLFGQSRGIKYRTNLLEYLKNHPQTTQSLGFESTNSQPVSQSTLSRAGQAWGMKRQPVQNTISRVQHALYRNGIFPDQFDDHDLSTNQPIPRDSRLPAKFRCQGLVNYSEILLRHLPDISLGRGPNTKYSPREIIAGIGQMALHDNPTKGRRLAGWQYVSDIITLQRIEQIISDNLHRNNIMLAKAGIERIDRELHRALFEFADDIGFFQKPIDIALDPTWIPVTGDVEGTPGAINNPSISGDSDGGYTFSMGASCTPIAPLSLGIKFITDKSEYENSFRHLLSRVKDYAEIGWLLADREFDSAETISLFQSVAGQQWIIRVREHSKVISPSVARSLEEVGEAQVSIGNHNVHAFATNFTTGELDWEDDDSMILLSGASKEKINPSFLARKYAQRWAVETYIRQAKHSFSFGKKGKEAPFHQFMFTIASVFYNIWQIVNQSVSPVYGYPMRARYYDVLKSIVESTLTARRQFYPQVSDM